MKVSFILVNYRAAELCRWAAESIQALGLKPGAFDVLIADNSPGEPDSARFLANLEGVVYLPCERNLGFGGACNRAIVRAAGEVVWLVNPDARFESDIVSPLLAAFAADDKLGAAGPALRFGSATEEGVSVKDADTGLRLKSHKKAKSLAPGVCEDASPQAKTGSPGPSGGLNNALSLLISFLSSLRPSLLGVFAPLREIPFFRAPLMENQHEALQESARSDPSPANYWRHYSLLSRWRQGAPATPPRPDAPPEPADWLMGASLALRREALDALGEPPFDERFFLYFEDADLCRRLRVAGWKIRHFSALEMVHLSQRSSSQAKRLALTAFFASLLAYADKWMAPADRARIRRQIRWDMRLRLMASLIRRGSNAERRAAYRDILKMASASASLADI